MKKRLIKNNEEEVPKSIKKPATFVQSSSSEESDNEEYNPSKNQRFQIVDGHEQQQGTINQYFKKCEKGEQPIMNQPQIKKNKILEFKMVDEQINEDKNDQQSKISEELNSDFDEFQSFGNLSHLNEITRNKSSISGQTETKQLFQNQLNIQDEFPIQNKTTSDTKFQSKSKETIHKIESPKIIEEEEEEEEQKSPITYKKSLNGQQYFILGDFKQANKKEIEAIIKDNGGTVVSVCKKKVIFVMGDSYSLSNGQVKKCEENQHYQTALKLKCEILKYDDFNKHLKLHVHQDFLQLQQKLKQNENLKSKSKEKLQENLIQNQQKLHTITPDKIKPQNLQEKFNSQVVMIQEIPKIQQPITNIQSKNKQIEQTKIIEEKETKSQLWTMKYAPKLVSDCLDQTHVQNIVKWLNNWGKQSLEIQKGSFQSFNLSAKALLLSGPPGIGKTTLIRLISKQMDYQLIEWNASDVRSKLQIESYVKHLQDNQVLKFKNANLITEGKTIILMDEVDGMGGSDKGGNKCLIDMIKLTKVPIVCICNDRNKSSVRTLANYCMDVQFVKPNSQQVLTKLETICKQENISYDKSELISQIEQSQCDIRQLMNMLQLHKLSQKYHLDIKIGKDSTVTTNVFDATKLLLSHSKSQIKINKLMEYYFQDADMTQLIYQENYLDSKSYPQNPISKIAQAASSLADADVMNTKVRSQMWGLMPNAGFLSTIYPTQILKGNLMGKPRFPQFFGRISSENKYKRQIQEVKEQFAQETFLTSSKAIQFQYIDPYAFIVIKTLSDEGTDSIDNMLTLLNNYKINVAQFEECIVGSIALFPKRDVIGDVPDAIRKAFNKAYKDKFDNLSRDKKNIIKSQTRIKNEDDLNEEEQQDEQDDEENVKKKDTIKPRKGKVQQVKQQTNKSQKPQKATKATKKKQ